MSTAYDGIPANVIPASPMNIASSTNANPIAITVSGSLPADFLTGVLVDVSNHAVNSSANGVYPATVTGASTFTIPVAGVGVGAATGTVQPLNLPPFFQIPSDGDACNRLSILSEFQRGGGDRIAFLAGATGARKLAARVVLGFDAGGAGTNWADIAAGSLVSGTLYQLTQVTAGLSTFDSVGGSVLSSAGIGNPFAVSFGGALPGDLVTVALESSVNSDAVIRLGLRVDLVAPGAAAPAFPGGYSALPLSMRNMPGGNVPVPFVLRGLVAPVTGSSVVWITPVVAALTTSSQSIGLGGDMLMTFEAWRPTGMPQ